MGGCLLEEAHISYVRGSAHNVVKLKKTIYMLQSIAIFIGLPINPD